MTAEDFSPEGALQQDSESSQALLATNISGPQAQKAAVETTDPTIARLPLQLDLRVPISRFKVQNLLSLQKGQILETAWASGDDLPLWCGNVQLVWTEFEVVDQKLAVRVTRLV